MIPGGFGVRGIEGMVAAAGYARDHDIPCLGLCLGLQVMVIAVARDWAGLERANSREFDSPDAAPGHRPDARPGLRDGQGRHHAARAPTRRPSCRAPRWPRPTGRWGSPSATATASSSTTGTGHKLEAVGLVCSGTSPDGRLVEFVELSEHPFWVGTQAHPEFKSRPDRPHPLFRELVAAALDRAEGREPHLLDLDRVPRPRAAGPTPASAGSPRRRSSGAWLFTRGRRPESSIPTASPSSASSSTTPVRWPSCRWTPTRPVTLVRQYRAAVDRMVLEVPAGTCDVAGEPPEATAQRELAEEAGLRGRQHGGA